MKNQLFIGGVVGLVLGYLLFKKKCKPCGDASPTYIIPNTYVPPVPPTTAAPVPPTTLAPTVAPSSSAAFTGAEFKQKYRKF